MVVFGLKEVCIPLVWNIIGHMLSEVSEISISCSSVLGRADLRLHAAAELSLEDSHV